MASTHEIAVDLAKVSDNPKPGRFEKPLRFLAFGDEVEVEAVTAKHVQIRTVVFKEQPDGSVRPMTGSGFIVPKRGISPRDVVVPIGHSKVLRIDFVDVQQGDGALLVTPSKRVMLIDGGDNQLFARYLAGQFRRTSLDRPRDVDCILVTHGDADHFAGLPEILASEDHDTRWKRLFIRPHRVYHNGLVKRPSKDAAKKDVPDVKLLGKTKKVGGRDVIVDLVDDLLAVPETEMNKPFRAWKQALATYRQRYGPIDIRRLQKGDDAAFDFLGGDGVRVEVLAPTPVQVNGRPALPFLGRPVSGPHLGNKEFQGNSASHTINGHSVVLRITYGNVRYLFAADLNQQSEIDLLENDRSRLEAEVLKVPHHGSADFSTPFIKAVAPIVSVVSSGDESEQKEHIHPRATLVGALGRHSRVDEPLVLVTELAAFFSMRGYIGNKWHLMQQGLKAKDLRQVVDLTRKENDRFFAFSRAAFGIVRTRTDGRRLLVYTDSADVAMKEAYAFEVGPGGAVTPSAVRAV